MIIFDHFIQIYLVAGDATEQTLTVQIDVVDDNKDDKDDISVVQAFSTVATDLLADGNSQSQDNSFDSDSYVDSQSQSYPNIPQVKNSIQINNEGNKELITEIV